MLRPNLYSMLTVMVMIFALHVQLNAQGPYYPPSPGQPGCPQPGCPQPGYSPGHQPLIRMPHSNYQAPIVDHYVQNTPGLWDDQQPIERFLGELTSRSWLKVEYLHWNIDAPGGGYIGAPVVGLRSPDQLFEGFDNLNGGISVGTSRVLTNSPLDLDDVSGVRGTWGLALNGGEMEVSFFGTEQRDDAFTTGSLKNFRFDLDSGIGNQFSPNVLLPLTTNGVATDSTTLNAIVFDESVSAQMGSQMWGAEASFLTDPYLPGEGFKWQWLGGFRYVNLDEYYRFQGVYNAGNTLPDRVTRINSSTANNIYGPQVGGRAQIQTRWFTLSATPRVVFGLNDYTSSVTADPLDTGVFTSEMQEEIEFCTITQLTLAAEVHLNNHLSLYGGYDFLWMPRISRPDSNIRYNSTPGLGGDFIPDIGLNNQLKNFLVEGLSVGAVLRY